MNGYQYTSVVLKLMAGMLGIVALLMGLMHVALAVFGLGGMDPSFSVWVGILMPLVAEVLALAAFIMMVWNPRIASGVFIAASGLFFGALVFFCILFAHVSGLELLLSLVTTPHTVYILPSWLPLLFAGLLLHVAARQDKMQVINHK